MLSKFNLNFDLSKTFNATILSNSVVSSRDTSVKLYIHTIMPNINKSEPSISLLRTNGYSVFKNGNKKPALTSNLLHEQNYLQSDILNDADTIDSNYSIEVKSGAQARAEFLNGKLRKLSYSLTSESQASGITTT